MESTQEAISPEASASAGQETEWNALGIIVMVFFGYLVWKCYDDDNFRWRLIIGLVVGFIIIYALLALLG